MNGMTSFGPSDSELFSISRVQGWITFSENDPDPSREYMPWVDLNFQRTFRELQCDEMRVVAYDMVGIRFRRNNSTVMMMDLHTLHCSGGLVWTKQENILEHFFGQENPMLYREYKRKSARQMGLLHLISKL